MDVGRLSGVYLQDSLNNIISVSIINIVRLILLHLATLAVSKNQNRLEVRIKVEIKCSNDWNVHYLPFLHYHITINKSSL